MSGSRPAQTTRGARDALTDVRGIRVGHAQWTGGGRLTGVTVVLPPLPRPGGRAAGEEPAGGAVCAVDVRGGGPGTRETEALDPRNLVEQVDALVLTGGSAFGLDAASGVTAWLEEQGRGFRVGTGPSQVVPLVPAAVLFDLGRGGDWRARPDAALGRAAAENAARTADGSAVAQGNVGAGAGAVAGGLKGGVGTAADRLPCGITVGALVAVNAAGSPCDPETGALYGAPGVLPGPGRRAGGDRRLAEARRETERRSMTPLTPPLNTTLAVVATDARLSSAQAQKLAGTAHDGLARAVRPAHLMTDGDTVFALATGERALPVPGGREPLPVEIAFALNDVLAAGADVLARAVAKAMLAAETTDTPGGVFPAYRDLYAPPDPAGRAVL